MKKLFVFVCISFSLYCCTTKETPPDPRSTDGLISFFSHYREVYSKCKNSTEQDSLYKKRDIMLMKYSDSVAFFDNLRGTIGEVTIKFALFKGDPSKDPHFVRFNVMINGDSINLNLACSLLIDDQHLKEDDSVAKSFYKIIKNMKLGDSLYIRGAFSHNLIDWSIKNNDAFSYDHSIIDKSMTKTPSYEFDVFELSSRPMDSLSTNLRDNILNMRAFENTLADPALGDKNEVATEAYFNGLEKLSRSERIKNDFYYRQMCLWGYIKSGSLVSLDYYTR
jgi:hypothetical protein